MTTDNFSFYLQNRRIQTSQTGGQRYSDTSPFSIPCKDKSEFRFRQHEGETEDEDMGSLLTERIGSDKAEWFDC